MDFGERLKHVRLLMDYTQDNVATHFGLTANSYRHYESGYRGPKKQFVTDLAVFFEISSFLLEPNNWSYVPTNTKGDIIAMLIELFKRDFIELTITEEQVQVEVPSHLSPLFKKCTPDTIADKDIVEALTRWVDVYEIDYLPHRDTNSDEVNQFVLDELDKLQIQLTLQNNQPLK